MREPAFSFRLHLFAAMILLVDVFSALSITTQTFRNVQRHSTDRQLRARDSQAKNYVIRDEERMPLRKLPYDLNLSLSSPPVATLRTALELLYPQAGPSQLWHFEFVTQMKRELSVMQSHPKKLIFDQLIGAMRSMNRNMHMKWNHASDISELSPYTQLILPIALKLRQRLSEGASNDADWMSLLMRLIPYGFLRKEVELLLRTAGYDNVQNYIALYDQMLSKVSAEDTLKFQLLDSNIAPNFQELNKEFLYRSVSLLASKTDGVTADSIVQTTCWSFILIQLTKAKYPQDELQKILEDSMPAEKVVAVMKSYKEGFPNPAHR
ncbi:RxLR-like protein [Plasmopara halstedii]|uniref:Secreted RxLR effector protein RXLR-C17 n=1 Tax=Plasmopara halstedii TaxID=4781 RepID=RLR17_PLAHL|nr:RxLR-like protein [Plasmopara halstedii]A0A0P1B5Z9.1 RecName: Full=Secreted RxLR effector protein RXLR-C17; Flags: Precursor [Plasmopara halstedii]CEG49264.1 RxLR-like protein [Plasmopara halstedii]|eukprot:XP_024585633.1 RxLR-like protein [Plasmopara halstedii]